MDDEIVAFGHGLPPATLNAAVRWVDIGSFPAGKFSAITAHLLLLPRAVRAAGVDVFHTPMVHTRPSMPPVPAGLGCPLVVTVHDVLPLTFYQDARALPWRMRLFYRWNLTRALAAERVITVSEAARREIIGATGVEAQRVEAIHNGVDVAPCGDPAPVLARLGLRAPFLLYVGSLEPRKNVLRLLDAFDEVSRKRDDLGMVLVTERDSGHRPALDERLARMRAGARVRLLHDVEDSELTALYGSASAFAFPSLAEGFGLPPLEAMACGAPVLAADNPVLHEVLGDAAMFVDALDSSAIAQGLGRLLADGELTAGMRRAGGQVARRFTWIRAAEKTLAVYRRLARGAARAGVA
jgi:glycosyltransferase involved in cell wall biosynthesis